MSFFVASKTPSLRWSAVAIKLASLAHAAALDSLRLPPVKTRQVTDGLSHTLAFAEVCVGPPFASMPRDPRQECYDAQSTPVSTTTPGQARAGLMALDWQTAAYFACDGATAETGPRGGGRSQAWASGNVHNGVAFNTVLPPNSPCWMANATMVPWHSYMSIVAPSASRHSGGVNVCLADSSVRFVADEIDPDTWSALSTRAGGEIITLND